MSEIIDGVTYYTVRFLNYAATDLLGTASVASGGDATATRRCAQRAGSHPGLQSEAQHTRSQHVHGRLRLAHPAVWRGLWFGHELCGGRSTFRTRPGSD